MYGYGLPDPAIVALKIEKERREKKERIWLEAALASLPPTLYALPGEARKAITRSFDCADMFIEELEKKGKL